jgi:hypothetical protein
VLLGLLFKSAEMLSSASISILCLANLAYAHSGRFQLRADKECCPCPDPDEKSNKGPATVTVTVVASVVTVTETSAPAADRVTVYISTAGGDPADKPAPTPETVYVTVANAPKPSADASAPVVAEALAQSAPEEETGIVEPETQPVTVTVQRAAQPEKTVTVHVNGPKGSDMPVVVTSGKEDDKPAAGAAEPNGDENTTVTNTGLLEDAAPKEPKTVTVNVAPVTAVRGGDTAPSAAPGAGSGGPNDMNNAAAAAEPTAIIVKQGHVVGAATVEREIKTETAMTPSTVTITTAPAAETPATAQNGDQFKTITQSVHNGDDNDIDIQINVININTGEVVCKKQDTGEPCEVDTGNLNTVLVQPLPAPTVTPNSSEHCPAATNSTSIATAFNTVTVVVKPGVGNSTDAAAAEPTGSTKSPAKLPRGPLSSIRW